MFKSRLFLSLSILSSIGLGAAAQASEPVRCFSSEVRSFGQRSQCIEPLLKRVCSEANILQSCEKNTNLIKMLYDYTGEMTGGSPQWADEQQVQTLHAGFLDLTRQRYPLLYNIITYRRRQP